MHDTFVEQKKVKLDILDCSRHFS